MGIQLNNFSWLRTYHCPIGLPLTPDEFVDLKPVGASALSREDLTTAAFFDIQMIEKGAVGRMRLPGISLSLPTPNGDPVDVRATLHYLFHASDFLVLRLTCSASAFSDEERTSVELADHLHQLFWNLDTRVSWSLDAEADSPDLPPLTIRELLTCFFLRQTGGDISLREAAESASGDSASISELVANPNRPFSFSYPVSGGSHFEYEADEPQSHTNELDHVLYQGLEVTRRESVPVRMGEWWGVSDNVSVSVSRPNDQAPANGALFSSLRPIRVQLIEMLSLRLGVLWSIQRDTQRFLISDLELEGATLTEWQRALLTANDDWTLDGRVGGLLATLERCLDQTASARSIRRLRNQVLLTISALQGRLDLAGQRATAILGVIFSIVAITSLASLIWIALAGIQQQDRGQDLAATEGTGFRLDDWMLDNWQLVVGVELGLILLAGVAIWIWFRRFASRISSKRLS